MTLVQSHPDASPAGKGGGRSSLANAARWLGAALKTLHDAIVAAKLRRLQNELMFGARWPQAEMDAADYPRRPAILGDKWDF